ncbi:hypothetical protein OH77DRAFT_1417955 [Trametes cingulata]|nr:hypothetical protein OH77DRAFT_1417955 [Trametes cingulata]
MFVRTPALYSPHHSPISPSYPLSLPSCSTYSRDSVCYPILAGSHSVCCVIATYHILFFAAAALSL